MSPAKVREFFFSDGDLKLQERPTRTNAVCQANDLEPWVEATPNHYRVPTGIQTPILTGDA